MAFSGVNDFLAKFKGGARPNRFRVNIVSSLVTIPDEIGFMCYAASVPASNIGAAVVTYMGNEIKVAGDRSFDDWTVSVYSDNTWSLRDAFETWSSLIMGHTDGIAAVKNAEQYMGSAEVEQLDRDESHVSSYFLTNLFPRNIGPINLDYFQRDQVETFEVTFAINNWTSRSAP